MAYKIPALPYVCPKRHSSFQVATALLNIPVQSQQSFVAASWVSNSSIARGSPTSLGWHCQPAFVDEQPAHVAQFNLRVRPWFPQFLRTWFPCPISAHGKNYLLNFITPSGNKDWEPRAVENMHIFYRQGLEVLGCKSSKNSSAARTPLLTRRDTDERCYKSRAFLIAFSLAFLPFFALPSFSSISLLFSLLSFFLWVSGNCCDCSKQPKVSGVSVN